ncbi:MAG TPA: hypothetical protein VHZ26_12605 [Caulobacteraceae bacterium]|jgi:extradiol dioxygenase family protein|nr:hypothetical protein [Caulobacteraceae bacterium]
MSNPLSPFHIAFPVHDLAAARADVQEEIRNGPSFAARRPGLD